MLIAKKFDVLGLTSEI